ncbi:unnamed protein product, partial [Mycena citricolor]
RLLPVHRIAPPISHLKLYSEICSIQIRASTSPRYRNTTIRLCSYPSCIFARDVYIQGLLLRRKRRHPARFDDQGDHPLESLQLPARYTGDPGPGPGLRVW